MSDWQTGQTNAGQYPQYYSEHGMDDDSGPLVSPFSANQVNQVDMSHWQRELFGQDPNQELVPLLTGSSLSATHQDPYTQHRQSQTDREARPLAPDHAMPSHRFFDAGREARMSLVEDQDPTRGLPIGPRPSGGIQGFAFHGSHSSIDNSNLMPHSNPALCPTGPSALSDTTGPSPNSTSALEKCTSWSMPNDNIPRSIGAPDPQEGSFGEAALCQNISGSAPVARSHLLRLPIPSGTSSAPSRQ